MMADSMAVAIDVWRSRAIRISTETVDAPAEIDARTDRAIKMRGLETEVVVPIVVTIDLETSTSAAAVVEKAEPTTEAIGRDTKKSGTVSVMAALIDVANFRI